MIVQLKKIFPESVLKYLRFLRSSVYKFIDSFTPFVQSRIYCGFRIFYTRGTGVIQRIRFGSPDRIYERDLSEAIVGELSHYPNPVFYDIGANIGLISLFVLSRLPKSNIFAFEPGPNQNYLFHTTIIANQLDSTLQLSNHALGATNGVATFHIHTDHIASSADGFLDTKRWGETKEIKVPVSTLDSFSQQNLLPAPSVIKIDTEGAELYVLQGAAKLLQSAKPIIFLEISTINLAQYPYSAQDIINFLEQNNYSLFTLDGSLCTVKTISAFTENNDTFVARPIKK